MRYYNCVAECVLMNITDTEYSIHWFDIDIRKDSVSAIVEKAGDFLYDIPAEFDIDDIDGGRATVEWAIEFAVNNAEMLTVLWDEFNTNSTDDSFNGVAYDKANAAIKKAVAENIPF